MPGGRERRWPLAKQPVLIGKWYQSKKNNIIGVQIADLCAHPCARHILNPARPNRAFEVAKKHIYNAGVVSGWRVFP